MEKVQPYAGQVPPTDRLERKRHDFTRLTPYVGVSAVL